MLIDPLQLQIQTFSKDDITAFADYFKSCSEEFLRSFGVDWNKVPAKEIIIENMVNKLEPDGTLKNFAIVTYQGKRIGNHNLTNLIENESGIFHAQMWNESYRNKGVGTISYIKACDHFLKNLNLKKIIFNTPQMNIRANRLKEKLGLPIIKTTIYEFPLMIAPVLCNQYEITPEQVVELKKKFGIS